jgi:hypothetical protein
MQKELGMWLKWHSVQDTTLFKPHHQKKKKRKNFL